MTKWPYFEILTSLVTETSYYRMKTQSFDIGTCRTRNSNPNRGCGKKNTKTKEGMASNH
jgi:hypothetical protein